MRKAVVIVACEVVVLAAIAVAFVLNGSSGVRVPPLSTRVVEPARVPSSVPVSIAIRGVAGRTTTAALSVRGGKAVALTVKAATTGP